MNVCTIHPHSTEFTARDCYERRIGKRADRKLRNVRPLPRRMLEHAPPRQAARGRITVFVFAEDANTEY